MSIASSSPSPRSPFQFLPVKLIKTTSIAAAILAFSSVNAATLMILFPERIASVGPLLTPTGGSQSSLLPLLDPYFDTYATSPLGAADVVNQADAFFVNLIEGGGTNGATYTPEELQTLAEIIASGKRAVIHFEWFAWNNSNVQLAALTGGTVVSAAGITMLLPEGTSSLVEGITGPISVGFGEGIQGGTRVFGDVVTLVGENEDVLLIGDANIMSDSSFPSNPNNVIFRQNVARFLGVPEPSSILLAIPALLLCAVRRRR